MKNLGERLVEFLGKPLSDPDFQSFLTEMKPYCHLGSDSYSTRRYHFEKLGFSISHCKEWDCIYSVAFHFGTKAVRTSWYARYHDLLPANITAEDNRVQIQYKLGVKPFRSTPDEGYPLNPGEDYPTWWDNYHWPPFRITLIFKSPVGDMDLFGVGYTAYRLL